jgi:hypothetical protein
MTAVVTPAWTMVTVRVALVTLCPGAYVRTARYVTCVWSARLDVSSKTV